MRKWNTLLNKKNYFWGMAAFFLYSIIWVGIVMSLSLLGPLIYPLLAIIGVMFLFVWMTYEVYE